MKKYRKAGSPAVALAEAGQALLEILLAFSVSIMVLGAVILSVVGSLNNAQYTKNQGLANSYAQEGMATIRKIRDSSWNSYENLDDISVPNTIYCLGPNSTNLTDSDKLTLPARNCKEQNAVPAGGIFSREVKFEHNSAACSGGSKTTVKVSWADSKCPAGTGEPLCHSVELITCFSSIDLKPTP